MKTILTALFLVSAALVSTAGASTNQIWNLYEKITAESPWKHLGEFPFDVFRAEETAVGVIAGRCTAHRFKDIFALKAVGPDGKTIEIDCMAMRRDNWPEDFDATGKRVVSGWQ